MPAKKKPRQPSRVPAPPDELRCTAISSKTGERCTLWAARRRTGPDGLPLTTCSGHSHLPLEDMVKGRKAQVAADRAEAERIALAGAEGQLRDAVKRLEEVDPLDPEAFGQALTERERKEAELRRLLHEQKAKNAARLEPPPRTTDMASAGTFWVKRGVHPDHPPPTGAVLDPETGSYFVWRAEAVEPPLTRRSLQYREDPDVERLRVDRLSADDERREREIQKEAREIIERLNVCQNPYAAAHYGAPLGLGPTEYVEHLERQLADLHGHGVDLNDDGLPEWEAVVLPILEREAKRRAWVGLGVSR